MEVNSYWELILASIVQLMYELLWDIENIIILPWFLFIWHFYAQKNWGSAIWPYVIWSNIQLTTGQFDTIVKLSTDVSYQCT
jgi:hypothetical protein